MLSKKGVGKYGTNGFDEVAILRRKKQKVNEVIENYQKILDMRNVKGSGLSDEEINLFRQEFQRLHIRACQAKVVEEYERVRVDLHASMK